jgi:F-type H+-transporting ATPase subunit b
MKRFLPAAAAASVLFPALAYAQAEAEQKGMPQLDFANPLTISQVVWLAIIFFALYLLLSRWALPQVATVIEARESSIADDLNAARRAKAQADAAVAEFTQATAKARADAHAAIDAAVARAREEAAQQARTLNAQLDARLAASERQITQARDAAMGALREVATETAAAVIDRLIGKRPDPSILDGAVSAALAVHKA